MTELAISEEDYRAFITVRESGVTNMLDVHTVSRLSDLSVEKVRYIIKHFDALTDIFE
jgi:hypothetical protein